MSNPTSRALRESVSDASQEASRLRAALVELRKEHADQDREHTREREHTAEEQAKAFAAMHARNEALQRELLEGHRKIHHADTERARVADEAGGVVEKAIMKREWALELLDKSAQAEEDFAKRLHYECYLAAALAVPEVGSCTRRILVVRKARAVLAFNALNTYIESW